MTARQAFDRTFLDRVIGDVRGVRRYGEAMAAHTSLRVGGPADVLIFPDSETDMQRLMKQCREAEVPVFVFGAGTNLLVRDGGIRGVSVCLRGVLDAVQTVERGNGSVRLEVGAGVALSQVVQLAVDNGLEGVEWAVGIPGTVGGAVATNAGAVEGSIGQVVRELRLLDGRGDVSVRPVEAFTFEYRRSNVRAHGTLLQVAIELAPGERGKIEGRVEYLLAYRRRTQPIGATSAGCIFRNPPGDRAARLIEAAGFKGKCVVGASVSPVHANFICNTGGAKARDILTLMERIRTAVLERSGVLLEEEVCVVGEEG